MVVPHAGDVDRNCTSVRPSSSRIVVPHAGDVDRNVGLTSAAAAGVAVVPHAGDVDSNSAGFSTLS